MKNNIKKIQALACTSSSLAASSAASSCSRCRKSYLRGGWGRGGGWGYGVHQGSRACTSWALPWALALTLGLTLALTLGPVPGARPAHLCAPGGVARATRRAPGQPLSPGLSPQP